MTAARRHINEQIADPLDFDDTVALARLWEIKRCEKVRLIDPGERIQIGAQLIAVGPRQKVFDSGVRVPPYRNGRDEKGPSGRG
jgi:hypothetical protein